MEKREREIQPRLEQMGAKGLLTRIGINTGPMVFGNMGSSQKFNYSVVGDSVNLPAGWRALTSFTAPASWWPRPTADRVRNKFVLRQLDLLRVKGKETPDGGVRVDGRRAGRREAPACALCCTKRLSVFTSNSNGTKRVVLGGLIERFPDDAPAKGLLGRVQKLRHDPPGPGWDGVYVAKDK